MRETIHNYNQLMIMLDEFLREPTRFWDEFYSDRDKPGPFFENAPDENLVAYLDEGLISKGKVLELGCGPGRNAVYLAEKGWEVDAVDLSETSLEWAKERAQEKKLNVKFIKENIFDLDVEKGTYDLVYDSGCFHHIAPHRRMCYINLIRKALKPERWFAITCFVKGGRFGGAEMTDWEVYREKSLKGGLGFTEETLKKIFHQFQPIQIRKMKETAASEPVFGIPELLTALFRY
ncbi:class I SAM-dependent methyltransferase [Halobacillus mangrovi]|uniref:SAM-dependent methyltransferase n=1 Tax=Halobacillus mangrovi TaxID=402384 RepID=A0A1W5ZXH2_9BACI|nr:class I SAM-dependent methyltransferase [Halobacillus mangrovi]ARI77960.1 SAM-dependent methyltransferase [Halobacillus mangrovi]